MKKVLSLILIVALSMTFLLTGCSSGTEYVTKDDEALNTSVVATVKDIEITQADYNFLYKMMFSEMSQYSAYYGENWFDSPIDESGTTFGSYMEENALQQLVNLATASILAEEKGVDIENVKDTAKDKKEDVIKNYGGKEGYISFLESSRTTDKAIENYLIRYEIYDRLCKSLTAEGGDAYISKDDVVKEFSESYMTVQHILVSTQEQTDADGNTTPARSDEEAQALVAEILGKIEDGAEFDALIEEYDEDPGMEPGKYYTFTDGQMVAEFEEASKNLEIGQYTAEAVKTDYGYHIIKRYDIDTTDENFKTFKEQKENVKINEVVEKKAESTKVKKNEDVIKKYLEPWIKELKEEAAAANAATQQAPTVTQEEAEAESAE